MRGRCAIYEFFNEMGNEFKQLCVDGDRCGLNFIGQLLSHMESFKKICKF